VAKDAVIEALQERVVAQDAKIEALDLLVADLIAKTGRDSQNSSRPPSSDDAWLHTRCAALNLRTLVKAGLTRPDGA